MRYLLQHRVRGTDPWESGWSLSCSIEGAKGDIDYTRYPNTEYRVLELRDVGNIFFEVWRTPKDEWIKGYFRVFSNGDVIGVGGRSKKESNFSARPDRLDNLQAYEVNVATGQVRLVPECSVCETLLCTKHVCPRW